MSWLICLLGTDLQVLKQVNLEEVLHDATASGELDETIFVHLREVHIM